MDILEIAKTSSSAVLLQQEVAVFLKSRKVLKTEKRFWFLKGLMSDKRRKTIDSCRKFLKKVTQKPRFGSLKAAPGLGRAHQPD